MVEIHVQQLFVVNSFPSYFLLLKIVLKTKFVVHKPYITLLWYTRRKMHQPRPDISGKGLALERQFAIDPGLPQVICIVLPL